MPVNDAYLNIAAAAGKAAVTHLSIHTATPNASGSNESTAPRKAAAFSTPSAGDYTLTGAILFEGGASGGPATHVGLWSALTGGTFLGYFALTGDQTFNAAGEYSLADLDINSAAA
ncbi:hypothetical protein SEA_VALENTINIPUFF_76 [Microbacterium phage ValentiniPuff]|uniref:Minor tail protein n=1 Tax=Microbacterium phage ValentiniPuff TaxID=2315705 RepID=A0A386KSA5_9CAUD|nr:hypothetical protein SEA_VALENTINIPUFF_76 [Microbacterium phage ValentiniPuff]